MGKIILIKEDQLIGGASSTPIYPITSEKSVYMTTGQSLEWLNDRVVRVSDESEIDEDIPDRDITTSEEASFAFNWKSTDGSSATDGSTLGNMKDLYNKVLLSLSNIGDLNKLSTTFKNNLVNAINEVFASTGLHLTVNVDGTTLVFSRGGSGTWDVIVVDTTLTFLDNGPGIIKAIIADSTLAFLSGATIVDNILIL